MCVLIYKPNGAALPTNKTLRACWNSNPDGAGFAFTQDGRVHFRKGFMTYNKFKNALRKCEIAQESHAIIHFRWATHGGVRPELTHPFPVGPRRDERIHALSGSCSSVAAHNGVLPIAAPFGHSDTSTFVRDVMGESEFYSSTGLDGFQFLLDDASRGSRIVELTPHGAVFYGERWEKLGGCYFSNLYFQLTHGTSNPRVTRVFYPLTGSVGAVTTYGRGSRANVRGKSHTPSRNWDHETDFAVAGLSPDNCEYCGRYIRWQDFDGHCPHCGRLLVEWS